VQLPPADVPAGAVQESWSLKAQWRILEIGFGSGRSFLETWRAWKDDPKRPALLHYVAIEAAPCPASQILSGQESEPGPRALGELLRAQWFGLLPGFHRLTFEGGRVLLTLCVGEARTRLREHDFSADSVRLDHAAAAPDLFLLKAIARLCRPGTQLAWRADAAPEQAHLRQCGFVTAQADAATDDPPAQLSAVFSPRWHLKGPAGIPPVGAGRCVVVGGGLAGGAAAASLARRGWQVLVLDAAAEPAGGASSLPAGLVAPHQSPDDSQLSRLCRSGVRITLQQASELLRPGSDWLRSGLLAHRADAESALPVDYPEALAPWSQRANAVQTQLAGLSNHCPALWHEQAGWVKPAALVRAWLAQPGITWRGGVHVAQIAPCATGWQLLGDTGAELALAELVVIAAAQHSAELAPVELMLQPVRGQVSWALQPPDASFPPFAVNGHGYFLSGVPLAEGPAWLCGATFDRDDSEPFARAADHAENLARLEVLLPAVATQLAPAFRSGQVQSWVGVRCASADRRPLVGKLAPGLWLSTAMGSRGLSFAPLCAELIAARLHREPLPLPRKLAQALDVQRQLELRAQPSPYPG